MSLKTEMRTCAGKEFGFVASGGKAYCGRVVSIGERGFVFEVIGDEDDFHTGVSLKNGVVNFNGRLIYEGEVTLSAVVAVGLVKICEAEILGDWVINEESLNGTLSALEAELQEPRSRWTQAQEVRPFFRSVVSDLELYLEGLESWCQQVELVWRVNGGDRVAREAELMAKVAPQVCKEIDAHFADYEAAAARLEAGERALHRTFLMGRVHRFILQSPFSDRCFSKPLGYAGDYEMVNLMMMNPFNGANLFAKLLNNAFLATGPVVAHRNRISYLTNMILAEVRDRAERGLRTRILNLGCGPAQEVRDLIMRSELCEWCEVELLDFSSTTLKFTESKIEEACRASGRKLSVRYIEESIQGFLKKVHRGVGYENGSYDLVYCAGLFDYLQQKFCQKLVSAFYDLIQGEGLVVVTNVSTKNTIPFVMEDFLEWSIIHRNNEEMLNLAESEKFGDSKELKSDVTDINLFLELRKVAERVHVAENQKMAVADRGRSGIAREVREGGVTRESAELSNR